MAARKFSRIGGNRPRTHPKSKPNVPAHSFGKPLRVLRNAKGHTREGLARRAPVKSSKKPAPPDDWIPDPLQDILETLTLIRATVVVCRSALRFEGFGDGEVEVVLKAHVVEALLRQMSRLEAFNDRQRKGAP